MRLMESYGRRDQGRHVEVWMRMSTGGKIDEYCSCDLTVIDSAWSFSNYRFKQKFSNEGII